MWNADSPYMRLAGSHSPNQSLSFSTSQTATSSQASTVVRVKKTAPSAAAEAPTNSAAPLSDNVKERTNNLSAGRSHHKPHSSRTPKSKHTHKSHKEKDKAISGCVPGTKHRPCKEHVFLTDVADVRQMETGLLQMLDDFHSGRLQAFGKECSFEDMDNVRDLQEKLSRIHFDLDSQQQTHGLGSDEAREAAGEHMEQLLVNLEQLSSAIQRLHPDSENNAASASGQ